MPRISDVPYDDIADLLDTVEVSLNTYATNLVLLTWGGQYLQLEPGGWGDDLPYPFPRSAFVLSGFNRGAVPRSLWLNQRSHARLMKSLQEQGWHVVSAAFAAVDGSWAENAAVVLDAPEDRVVEVAREHGVPALVRWDPAAYTVLPLVDAPAPGPLHWRLRPRVPGCPMLLDPGPGEACRNPGGPWIPAAWRAAALWRNNLDLLRGTRGCAVCASTAESETGQ